MVKHQQPVKDYIMKRHREELKAYAESKGMSINGYINKLIDEDMKTADKE